MTQAPGGSLWEASARERFEGVPVGTGSVDLAIIGGGFTGCAAALQAARQGASVTVFEAETVGHGGSGRNVGLVNAGLWLPPDAVEGRLGQAAGARLNTALAAGPGLVFDLVRRHEIACDAVQAGTLHCAHADSALADLQERQRQQAARNAPVRLLTGPETARSIGSNAFAGALHDKRAGTVHPLSYVRGLARAASEAGARIHERSPVRRLRHEGGSWQIETDDGALRARRVLVATNAYHREVAGLAMPKLAGVHYFQIATVPLPEHLRDTILPGGEGCWDTGLVMSSFRLDAKGRFIYGGMGNTDWPGASVHLAWARRSIARRFPQLGDMPWVHAWCGRIAMSRDYIPKAVAIGPGAMAIFGYSGRGIAPGTVLGRDAAKALLADDPDRLSLPLEQGYHDPWAGLRTIYYETGARLNHAVRRS